MTYDVSWAFPCVCEHCRSPLTGADIIAVVSRSRIDLSCSGCSKVNEGTNQRLSAFTPRVEEESRGAAH